MYRNGRSIRMKSWKKVFNSYKQIRSEVYFSFEIKHEINVRLKSMRISSNRNCVKPGRKRY